MSKGRVYVGKKASRGMTGFVDPIMSNVKNINATSGSLNKINGLNCKQFSPMYLGPVIDENGLVAKNFENYWQYGKIFKELKHIDDDSNVTNKWLTFRKKGYQKNKGDRHPVGTKSNEVKWVGHDGKNHYRYYSAVTSCYNDKFYDYISSRKQIYVKIYAQLVVETDAFKELKKQVDQGLNIQILDFDILNGSHEISVEFLRDRVDDHKFPFGHGYVLAGLLADITPDQYCN